MLAAVPPERVVVQPIPGSWSVLETFEHVARVEAFVVTVLRSPPTSAPPVVGGVMPGLIRSLPVRWRLAILARRMGRVAAPKNVRPHHGSSAGEVHGLAHEARAGLVAFVDHVDPRALGALHVRHPVLGMFDGFDWIDFLAAHEERHLRQAHAALRTPG